MSLRATQHFSFQDKTETHVAPIALIIKPQKRASSELCLCYWLHTIPQFKCNEIMEGRHATRWVGPSYIAFLMFFKYLIFDRFFPTNNWNCFCSSSILFVMLLHSYSIHVSNPLFQQRGANCRVLAEKRVRLFLPWTSSQVEREHDESGL